MVKEIKRIIFNTYILITITSMWKLTYTVHVKTTSNSDQSFLMQYSRDGNISKVWPHSF